MLSWNSANTDNPGDQVADTTGGHWAIGPATHGWSLTLVQTDERDGQVVEEAELGTWDTETDVKQAAQDLDDERRPAANPGNADVRECDERCALHHPDCDGNCDHGVAGDPHRNACLPDMTAPTENDNCLDEIRCPRCGSERKFDIEATTIATVLDDGVDETHDMEWGDNSSITCRNCSHAGTVADFTVSRPLGANETVLAAEPAKVTLTISQDDLSTIQALYQHLALNVLDLDPAYLRALAAVAVNEED